ILDKVQAELSRSPPGIDWEDLPDGVDDFEAAFVATPGAGLLKIIGPDLEELERLAGKARGELRKLAGARGGHGRTVLGKGRLKFRVDPAKCARWGVSVADVKNVIAAVMTDRAASHMMEGEKVFDISIRVLRSNEASILDIPVDIGPPGPFKPRLRLRDLVT